MRRLSRFSVAVTLSPPASDTDPRACPRGRSSPRRPRLSEAELRGPLAGSRALSTVYLLVKSGHEP